MKYKDLEHDAFEDYPKGNRAVISYSHYYHKWMVANEEEDEEWNIKWWESERYRNTFRKWAYVDDVLSRGDYVRFDL